MRKDKFTTIKVYDMHMHENTLLNFTDHGIIVSTGVNVTEEIAGILARYPNIYIGRVYFGEKMFIYKRAMLVESIDVKRKNIISVQQTLLHQAREDIRLAKIHRFNHV